MNRRKSLTVSYVAFYMDHVFNTPTKCAHTIKYMHYLSSFLLHVSTIIAPSSGRNFLYMRVDIKKLLPEDGAIIAETCRRKDDN